MAEDIQKYSLDAEDYFSAVDKIVSKNRDLATSLLTLGTQVASSAKNLNQHAKVLNDLKDAPKEFIAALRLLGAQYDSVSGKAKITNADLAASKKVIEDLVKAYDEDPLRSVEILLESERKKQAAILETKRVQKEAIETIARLQQAANQGTTSSLQETRDVRANRAVSQPSLITGFIDKSTAQQVQASALAAQQANLALTLARAKGEGQVNHVLEQQDALYKELKADSKNLASQQKQDAKQVIADLEKENQARAKLAAQSFLATNVATNPRAASAVSQISTLIQNQKITAERANEIIQQVGNNTSAVFTGVEARVASHARTLAAAQGQINTFNTKGVQKDVKQLGDEFIEADRKSQKASFSLDISWKTVARLFVFQALHTAVRQFIQEIETAITTAENWEIKISEIRTITQDAPMSFDKWSDAVRRLSDQFANPIGDVTEGVYQTISNQVGKGTTAINFMNRALEFSKATGASTADSVNLLSAVLNSFGYSAGQTERVASVLFTTIDKGRVRADQIANTFGRVGPSARALGLNIEDVGAAFATLTQAGISPSEAMTLLNNVMNGLIRPSKEMKEVFKEIGVSTGEAAVQTHGFIGVLEELEKHAGGSSSELASLFTNIRGARGATIFAGQGLRTFQMDLEAMTNGLKIYQNAVQIGQESPGFQLQKQLNEIKNIAVADIAKPLIESIINISNSMGGLANVFKTVINAANPILSIYIAYKASAIGASLATSTLTKIEETSNVVKAKNIEMIIAQADAIKFQEVAMDRSNILREQSIAANLEAIQTEEALSVAKAESSAMIDANIDAYLSGDVALTKSIQANEALIATLEAEALAYREVAITAEATATIQEAAAVSTSASAAAMTEASVAGTLLAKVGSGLLSIASSPIFILTAAAAAFYYLYTQQGKWEKEVKESYEKASAAAEDYYNKLTETVEKELGKQSEAFEHQLNHQFTAYVDFGEKVINELDKILEIRKEDEQAALEASKNAIHEYVDTYKKELSSLESEHTKTLENIRKTEEDLENQRETFAARQFKRELKDAQHKDKQDGGGLGHPFGANEVALINARKQQLLDEIGRLAQPTNNSKTDADNRERSLKLVKELGDIEDSQGDKRNQIDDEQISVHKRIKELQEEHAAELAKRAVQDQENETKLAKQQETRLHRENKESGQHGKKFIAGAGERSRHEEETDILTSQSDEEHTAQLQTQREEEDRKYNKKVATLQIEEKNLNASLQALPTINQLKQQSLDIERQEYDINQKNLSIMQNESALQQQKIEEQKKYLDNLETALKDLEKFKIDPKINITKPEQVEEQVKKFDDLVENARSKGASDQNLLAQFAKEEAAIRAEAQAQLDKNQAKSDSEHLISDKKAILEKTEANATALSEAQKKVAEASKQIFTEVGGIDLKGEFIQGRLLDIGSSLTQPGAKQIKDYAEEIEKVRIALADVNLMLAQNIEGKGPFDINKVQKLAKSYDDLQEKLRGPARGRIGDLTGVAPKDIIIGKKTDISGKETEQTINDLIIDLHKNVQDVVNEVVKTQQLTANKAQNQQDVANLAQREQDIQNHYNLLNIDFQNQSKSIESLTGGVDTILVSLKKFQDKIDSFHLSGTTPIPNYLGGANLGTDTMLAAVSPGEFIMNARSSRKFYRQLTSMNRYSDGGMVSFNPNFSSPIAQIPIPNNNDSSISVSVGQIIIQGTNNPQYDARQIGRALQTEIRRGTISLRNAES